MIALGLHLRFSVARWAFVPLSGLGVAVLFGRSRFWIGIWPEAGAAVQVSAIFLSIFAAAIAAWIAAVVERQGLREQTSSAAINPVVVEATRFGATLLWVIAPYLVVALAGFVATAITMFPPGVGSYFEYVLLGTVVITFGTAWGWLVGRLLVPLLSAVCAALSWFIAATFLSDAFGAALLSGPPWLEVRPGSIGLRLVAVLLFAVTVCALPWRGNGQGRFRLWVVVALVALTGAFGVHMTTGVVRHRAPVAKPLCVRGVIEYCLWPEHAKYVPMVKALDRRVAKLPVRFKLPERVVDYALSGSTKWIDQDTEVELPGSFDPEFEISTGSRWALARGVASAILKVEFAKCDFHTQPDPDHRWDKIFAWLEWRLAGGGKLDYSTNAPTEMEAAWSVGHQAAIRQSEQDQAVWASELIAGTKGHYCYAA